VQAIVFVFLALLMKCDIELKCDLGGINQRLDELDLGGKKCCRDILVDNTIPTGGISQLRGKKMRAQLYG